MTRYTLELLNYSRIQLCILAMSLTAASSQVLVGQIEWPPVLIAGLSTFAIYNLDNLLDWPSESYRFEAIQAHWGAYFFWCAVTVPLALLGVFVLAIRGQGHFVWLLLGLGAIALVHTLLTRRPGHRPTATVWAEHLTDSLVWALVIVLIPVWYVGQPIVAQVVMAAVYMWQLCWVGVMVWNFANATVPKGQHRAQPLWIVLGERRLKRLLQIVSLLSMVLALVDILLGYFPWYNFSVASGPLVNLIFLSRWDKFRATPRLYASLFYFMSAICGLLVIVVYIIMG